MNKLLQPLIAALLLAATGPLMAADTGRGESLKQKNCMGCHEDGVYTRQDRRVSSLDGLEKQVRRCELTLGLQWFDEDVNDVVAYLNQTFYKFK